MNPRGSCITSSSSSSRSRRRRRRQYPTVNHGCSQLPKTLVTLLLLTLWCPTLTEGQQSQTIPPQQSSSSSFSSSLSSHRFPLEITLRGAVLHAPPFATVEEQEDGSVIYGGFQPDMLQRLQVFAAADNVTLNFNLSTAPTQYGPALDLVANDCDAVVENARDNCHQLDLIVGNYYATPERALRVDLSPAWLRSTISLVKYVEKKNTTTDEDFTTLQQASGARATVCLKNGTFYAGLVKAKFPDINYLMCETQDYCLETLKQEQCVLYADDELQLRYRSAWDPSLEVTKEHFNTQYIVWPMSLDLDPMVSLLMNRWIFAAVTNATLDELYFQYFQKALCPIGTAGEACELPCDPDHGEANARGVCVCQSSKWTGDDCSIEVMENTNMIPPVLKILAYCMFFFNMIVIIACGVWLYIHRKRTQIRVSQPFFLVMVLVGCLISSSTIIALAQEDEGSGPVPACMAIPWLYSVGFSVTFGTLFAKIRRVYIIFKSSVDMRRTIVTMGETLTVIGAVLAVDVAILLIWTFVDPLNWQRTVVSATQLGEPLESDGTCTSEHWWAFAGVIAGLHLLLLGIACYLCYVSRAIPTKFSEGKYVSIAMISNLQVFVVAVPILIILGSDGQTSFFVRSVIVWMNDFVVVALIFGNLMYSIHFDPNSDNQENVKQAVGNAIQHYSRSRRFSSRNFDTSGELSVGSSRKNGGLSTNHGVELQSPATNRPAIRNSFSSIMRDELLEEHRIPLRITEGVEPNSTEKEFLSEVDEGNGDLEAGRILSKAVIHFDVLGGDKRKSWEFSHMTAISLLDDCSQAECCGAPSDGAEDIHSEPTSRQSESALTDPANDPRDDAGLHQHSRPQQYPSIKTEQNPAMPSKESKASLAVAGEGSEVDTVESSGFYTPELEGCEDGPTTGGNKGNNQRMISGPSPATVLPMDNSTVPQSTNPTIVSSSGSYDV